MNQMTTPQGQGAALQVHRECGLDCQGCLTDFERTQQEVEALRLALGHASVEQQELWEQLRGAVRQTVFDLIPPNRPEGVPGDSEEFRRGWAECRAEIHNRVNALLQVL
jgi:hypothetical protein